MSEKLKVGILGGTGMVGQRFIALLENHPWFEVTAVAASPRSAGKTYEEAVGDRWKMDTPMPEAVKNLVVMSVNEVEQVASGVDFVFSAVDMTKGEIKKIEEDYARTETPVVSNNSAHRWTPDVPMMVPEIILGMVFMAFFSLIGLPFGMGTLVLAHTAFCIPYVFMLVKARLVGMDPSLAEAAQDLGAPPVRVFFDVTLPLTAPAIASGMLLAFAMSIDDVIISVFVTGVDVNTLPIKIYTQLKTGVTPEVNALCTLMFLATLAVCLLAAFLARERKAKE